MNMPVNIERCFSFINCQVQPPEKEIMLGGDNPPKRAITLSRQSGCGAHTVTEKLAALLQSRAPKGGCPWTVFDRNLMEQVLADHHLPERMARFIPEDRITEIDDVMNDLFGERPSAWTIVKQTSETILRLAELGNVILLGRGANVITARLSGVLHVRLIASLESRVQHMQQFEELTYKAALARIRCEDLGRSRYLRKYFNKDIEDPLLYHLVINTDLVSLDNTAKLIAETLFNCCKEVQAR
jgi:cytidylate kinase